MPTQADKVQKQDSPRLSNKLSDKSAGQRQPFQFVDNRPQGVAQRKLQNLVNNSSRVKQATQLQAKVRQYANQRQPTIQKKGNNTGLPDNLKSGIENLSGYAMDDVKVHYNSDQPAQLQAHAYAQGTDIHLGPGQEKHLPHEAWHVVQQKQGRVKPTMQMKGGVNLNDDIGLEKEADVMGAQSLNSSVTSSIQLRVAPPSNNTMQLVSKFGFEMQAINTWVGKKKPNQKYALQMGKQKAYETDRLKIESDDRDLEIITNPIPKGDEDAKNAIKEALKAVHEKIIGGNAIDVDVIDEQDRAILKSKSSIDSLKMAALDEDFVAIAPSDGKVQYKVQITFGSRLSELNRTMRGFLTDDQIWRDEDDPAKAVERKAQKAALDVVPSKDSSLGGLVSLIMSTAIAIKHNKPGSMNKDILHFMQRTEFKTIFDSLKMENKDSEIQLLLEKAASNAGLNWETPLMDEDAYRAEMIQRIEKQVKLAVLINPDRLKRKKLNKDTSEEDQEVYDKMYAAQLKFLERSIKYGIGKALFIGLTIKQIYQKLIANKREELSGAYNLWASDLSDEQTTDLEKDSDETGTIMEVRRIKKTADIDDSMTWIETVSKNFNNVQKELATITELKRNIGAETAQLDKETTLYQNALNSSEQGSIQEMKALLIRYNTAIDMTQTELSTCRVPLVGLQKSKLSTPDNIDNLIRKCQQKAAKSQDSTQVAKNQISKQKQLDNTKLYKRVESTLSELKGKITKRDHLDGLINEAESAELNIQILQDSLSKMRKQLKELE